jgi:acyl-CoA synthetase (AMP-forming)/AMP-acid ligase II
MIEPLPTLETLPALVAVGRDDAVALAEPGGVSLTYAALRASIDAVARGLRARGIARGATVALAMPNGLGVVVAFLGIARAGCVAAPLNPAYTQDEFTFYLDDIGPALVLAPPGAAPLARAAAEALRIPVGDVHVAADGAVSVFDRVSDEPLEEPAPDDIALFLHTSGTTSRPKGVPLRHENLCASAQNIARWYALTGADVSLCVMPLFHVHGLVFSTLAFLAAGAQVVIPEKFSASAFWPTVAAYRATVVSAVPTILRTLLIRADDDGAPTGGGHTLRFLRSSSAALPAADFHKIEARFGVPLIEAYSMTEAAHQMCASPLDGERRGGSVGVGAHVEVAILDDDGNELGPDQEGEVAVRGRNVMRGYHNNPAANAVAFTNGWFRTGDRGKKAVDGYLTLVGRLKELINRAGEKISPVEIDEALAAHPGVIEAVTFAIPDEKYGEEVAAAVVLRAGTTTEELAEHVRARLAPFKVPKRFFVTDAIPKTATGKVQRRIVAAAFAPGGTA